jgi:hypothetical protein
VQGISAYSSANDSTSRVSRGISGAGFLHQLACKRPRAWYTNGTPSARFGKATACEPSTHVRIVRPIAAATRSKTSGRRTILAPARILPCGFIRAGGRRSLDVTPEGRARRTNVRVFGWSGSASRVSCSTLKLHSGARQLGGQRFRPLALRYAPRQRRKSVLPPRLAREHAAIGLLALRQLDARWSKLPGSWACINVGGLRFASS